MKEITFVTNARGKKVAAVVPVSIWKRLDKAYRKLSEQESNETPAPNLRKRKKKWYRVSKSGIHGKGVFAARDIPKGKPVIEYKGDHISQDDANERYGEENGEHHHTVLFTVDDDTVIDANRKGNAARFINHSCAPNCEAVQYGERIFIESIRDIRKGEELTYDYHLQVDKPHTKKKLQAYVCYCGAPNCRGTQVDPG